MVRCAPVVPAGVQKERYDLFWHRKAKRKNAAIRWDRGIFGTPDQTLTGGLPLMSHDCNSHVVNHGPSRLS